ncbi:hypothetical protein [Aureispira anguillae]|uniref:Uncharacterized protein n=1 Tax=Aureispira anguillae TaxID=2864201 RepID=A0A915YGZ8_9BACT|nr:hypothetical protein [Aureispira anguillae]BDS12768.1 hypothetical protein AsAng_0034930 [Aureispira anguillae]
MKKSKKKKASLPKEEQVIGKGVKESELNEKRLRKLKSKKKQ